MKTDKLTLAYSYLRLSNDEAKAGESTSITNQRMIVQNYCRQHSITLLQEFVDDGYSGGNFNRPGFQALMEALEKGKATMVITKDLSRLGRDMREASYYAEQFFPENGIRYIAIADNFDTEHENIMAPFQFAMNEVYLRDGSRKVKDVLKSKREDGQYCATAPYGYRKDQQDKAHLVPDEATSPIVLRIFQCAAAGDSSRKIAMDLNNDGIVPPLKHRVLYTGKFSPEGAARASDLWNYTTVKRILKNPVYLGHTLLGKTRKVSVKSKKKVKVPKENWAVTMNTHPALVAEELFNRAQVNLGKGSSDFRQFSHVRKSIFGGIAVCSRCGYSLCSCGTVYKGEREKYWYLACNHMRKDIDNPCEGVRIRYTDLVELVKEDLNSLLALSEDDMMELAREAIRRKEEAANAKSKKLQLEQAKARIITIDKMVEKLYTDNAEGRIDDARLIRLVADLEQESAGLQSLVEKLATPVAHRDIEEQFMKFFNLAKSVSHLETLDREILLTFIDKIEVGPKELPEGKEIVSHRNMPFRQSVRIFYKFIGEIAEEPVRDFPAVINL